MLQKYNMTIQVKDGTMFVTLLIIKHFELIIYISIGWADITDVLH